MESKITFPPPTLEIDVPGGTGKEGGRDEAVFRVNRVIDLST